MRVLLAAGGTGGHLIPALRIAEAMARREGALEMVFVGSDRGFEESVIRPRGYRYVGLPARGLARRRWWRNASAVWNNLRAGRMAKQLIRDFRPDVAVGCGGYASYFPIRAAVRAGIPAVLQEQNRRPGLVTRWLSPKAEITFVAFPETREALPKSRRSEWVGNPVDPRLATLSQAEARQHWSLSEESMVILVTGGSTGARSMNQNIARGLKTQNPAGTSVILWQTGAQGSTWDGRAAAGWTVRQFPFTDRMTEAFVAADVIIARAGALTVSEITAAGKPAILVPFPFAAAEHQRHNAAALADVGGAVVVEDDHLEESSLLEEAVKIASDLERRRTMAEANRSLARPDAADKIAQHVISLAHGQQNSTN
ncbi:MAG: undecaprenyldiphospho-muramoylpentapeptide beta-N-acetylglucosaminyltransferase [candidate division Zixibacteria bacterium]|nr:undecaprenyldiphospho-muramoylpentapeptide beta-N-acetylglucosaminyltransferase [candidate division Zixibacteria bacterium]